MLWGHPMHKRGSEVDVKNGDEEHNVNHKSHNKESHHLHAWIYKPLGPGNEDIYTG